MEYKQLQELNNEVPEEGALRKCRCLCGERETPLRERVRRVERGLDKLKELRPILLPLSREKVYEGSKSGGKSVVRELHAELMRLSSRQSDRSEFDFKSSDEYKSNEVYQQHVSSFRSGLFGCLPGCGELGELPADPQLRSEVYRKLLSSSQEFHSHPTASAKEYLSNEDLAFNKLATGTMDKQDAAKELSKNRPASQERANTSLNKSYQSSGSCTNRVPTVAKSKSAIKSTSKYFIY